MCVLFSFSSAAVVTKRFDVLRMETVSCTEGAEERALEVVARMDSRACQKDYGAKRRIRRVKERGGDMSVHSILTFSSMASFGNGVDKVREVRLLSSLIQPFTED